MFDQYFADKGKEDFATALAIENRLTSIEKDLNGNLAFNGAEREKQIKYFQGTFFFNLLEI